MSLRLSALDVRRLQRALQVLLSPWDTDGSDIARWGDATCRAVRELLEVESAVAIWNDSPLPLVACDGALRADKLRSYVAEWHGQLTGERRRHQRGLRTWVREDVWPRKEVEKTAYYNEYCIPAGFRDSAGMVARLANREQHILYVADARRDRFALRGREALLLELLQPAFQAGSAARYEMANLEVCDSHATPAGILTLEGRLLHANRAFVRLTTEDVTGNELLRASRHLALHLAKLVRSAFMQFVAPVWWSQDRTRCVRAALWQPARSSTPYCVITIGDGIGRDQSERISLPLTPREAEVAELVARGFSNKEVAAALGTSTHTARRHTERILRKLGVHSRAKVALALDGNEGLPQRHRARPSERPSQD